ncbi:hypothetical protein Hanom_Chr05g00443141 [Helianthus anomalus]
MSDRCTISSLTDYSNRFYKLSQLTSFSFIIQTYNTTHDYRSTLDRNEVPIAAKQSEPVRWFVGGGSVRKLVSPARECGTEQSVYMSFRV